MMVRLIVAASLAAGFSIAGSPASAQSVNYCIDQCFNVHPDNQLRDMCVQQCRKPKVLFGAIAYGPQSEATGWSYDYETEDEARHHALSNCAKHGNDCRVVTSFSNACGAVAAGSNQRYAIGEGVSATQAKADAIANCRSGGGTECDIQAWSCTNR